MPKKPLNNQGFTLVEVLISIVILAILLVPALSGFATLARVNRNSVTEQKALTLAQNILESLETMSLDETAKQFSGTESFRVISSNLNGFTDHYIMDSHALGGYGAYMFQGYKFVPADSVYLAQKGRQYFYYVMKGVKDHGTTFDAMITLDTATYSDPIKYANTMNNYKMPRLLELNDSTIAIIDLNNSPDEIAVNNFKLERDAYIAGIADALPTVRPGDPTPIPTPVPPEISKDDIKAATKKDITVDIFKNATNNSVTVTCKVQYTCNLDLNEDGLAEVSPISEVFQGNFNIPSASEEDANVYLFYTESIFTGRDTIYINNKGAKVNFYLANQGTSASGIIVQSQDISGGLTKVYSNYMGTTVNGIVVSDNKLFTDKKDNQRIYNITVAIYPEGTIASGILSKPYVTLTSAKEN